jgi:hypothetical protein
MGVSAVATDIHVNWSASGGASSGTGTSGDPYGSIAYAVAQQVAAQPNLATLGGLVIHVHDTANTGCPSGDRAIALSTAGFTNASTTNFVTIRAGDDKRPSGTMPVLEINPTGGSTNWDIALVGTTIDGFYFHHTGTAQVNHIFLRGFGADAIKIRNCWFYADPRSFGSSARYVEYNTNAVVENCVFRGGREHCTNNGSGSTLTLKNCLFIDQNTADTCVNLGSAALTMYSCAFFNVSIAVTTGSTINGGGNAIDGSTKGATGSVWSVDGTLTSAAFANYASQDYRNAGSGALINAGDPSNSTATDMFGSTRSTPDIGFNELVAITASGAIGTATASAPAGTASSARSCTVTLVDENNVPLNGVSRRFWTRQNLQDAAADGGAGGLAVTCSPLGVFTLTGLSVATGAGWLTFKNAADDMTAHIVPVTYV